MEAPAFYGLRPGSEASANFAMSTMYLHWSITPYAIYCIPALMFALGYYNHKRPFRISTTLFPFIKKSRPKWDSLIDVVCLFALVSGMAASLGAGLMSLTAGVQYFTDIEGSNFLLGLICLVVVASFIASSISGIKRGIKVLSIINVCLFLMLLIYLIFFGPLKSIGSYFVSGMQSYLGDFAQHSLLSITEPKDEWSKSWTVFYWANWMAWTPVSALFLGKIGYGYTVRQFMTLNWIIPSAFSMLFMTIVSGTTLALQQSGAIDLSTQLLEQGPESIIYSVLEQYPFSIFIIMLFVVTIYLSFITAADSNTEAMACLSTTGISPETPDAPIIIKIVWGVVVGLLSFVMVSYSGIDGVKMLSNLGGFPALFLIIGISVSLLFHLYKRGN